MARAFTTAGSDKLRTTTLPIASGTPPFSMACWFNPVNVSSDQYLMSMSDEATTNNYHILYARGAVSGQLTAHSRAGADPAYCNTTIAASTATWNHACGVWSSTSARAVYLNGANKGSQSGVSATPAGLDNFVIGALDRSASDVFSDCTIAEAAVWNVALTDDDVLVLATGVAPTAVRPASLVGYWPLLGRFSPEIDVSQGHGLTLTGTTAADHPPIRYPVRQRITKAIPVVAATTKPRVLALMGVG